MKISIYTLTSPLHDKKAIELSTRNFLDNIGIDYDFFGDDYSQFGTKNLDLIFVRTGGTENLFLDLYSRFADFVDEFYLLTSGENNSLAASMEILSFLNSNGHSGEILHGSSGYIRSRIVTLSAKKEFYHKLHDCRLGVIGAPSDWLIASGVSSNAIYEKLGIRLHDIPMRELLDEIAATPLREPKEVCSMEKISSALPVANQIYDALKALINRHRLSGFTLRCFDLLSAVHNTGCLALAKLNSEGYVAGCEGDVPTMITMAIVNASLGISGFQANPSSIDIEKREVVFAHCTVPLNMVESYDFDSHFESGIGVGIRGQLPVGDVTIIKLDGKLKRFFIAEGQLLENLSKSNLCRTQVKIRLDEVQQTKYFLTNPIANHHVIVPGHHADLLTEFLQ